MKFADAIKKSALNIFRMSPMILGILGLAALLTNYVQIEDIRHIFTGDKLPDTLKGTFVGSLMLGNAVISYILGGELLQKGISYYAITAFLLAWVSVGIVQIPMEIQFFGKRFVFIRTAMAIGFTLILTFFIVQTYNILI